MRIDILGCSGSVAKGYNTTSFLINDTVLIDAGSAASELSETSLAKIQHILLTHPHIDHIKELPFILDPILHKDAQGVHVWGSKETMEAIRMHIFNGSIWPDLQEIAVDNTALTFAPIPSDTFSIANLEICPIPVDHIPGSLAYAIAENGKYILVSGDTGYFQELFDFAASFGKDLQAFFIEASFPNHLNNIARISKHLTPALVKKGIEGRIPPSCKVIVYHLKPNHFTEIIADLSPQIEYIKGGEVFYF